MSGEPLDATDRRLVAVLREDGRASISALAANLGLARGTVRARIESLRARGVIRRFTIDIGGALEPETVRAVMTIELKGSMTRQVIRALEMTPEITAIHTTNGAWDLVAEINASSLPAFDRVLREVRAIQGVSNSQTSLLLDTLRG
ncbi:Lrp/AsnC family transcriptional regulator [Pikeienuella piscinae]|uniref:Lrp/AsnC family transcriptional regulator n=1 Tax=Pikeienuella piscinae TaxID=2748098 RepID=A0A7M3T554_9RHOB|nr:Lrp/AsnC family transcriptional regulator [Pikeienuella piscinae]QIE57135.1 Lrp/AsnC family transcriptional regulator [Pikeienuella piscinae]